MIERKCNRCKTAVRAGLEIEANSFAVAGVGVPSGLDPLIKE